MAVKALREHPYHLPTLQLLVLLLSAQKAYGDGLSVVEETLEEFPEHLGFLQVKAVLEARVGGPEASLPTLKQMLVIWKKMFEDGNFPSLRCESPDPRFPPTGGGGGLSLPSPTAESTCES